MMICRMQEGTGSSWHTTCDICCCSVGHICLKSLPNKPLADSKAQQFAVFCSLGNASESASKDQWAAACKCFLLELM